MIDRAKLLRVVWDPERPIVERLRAAAQLNEDADMDDRYAFDALMNEAADALEVQANET